MAGGLFGRPFVLNEKCIVFSLICMTLFLFKPTFRNQYLLYFTLFIIFVVAYVAMAWYDYYFNCDIVPLKRGTKPLEKFSSNEKQFESLSLFFNLIKELCPCCIDDSLTPFQENISIKSDTPAGAMYVL